MKDQLLLLVELQKIDSKIHELESAMRALPEKLRPAKQDLARLEAMLEAERKQIADTEAWKVEQESLVRRDEEDVKHAKMKLQAAKNTRDFAAASREVDNKRRSIAEREDEILKVVEAVEATRSTMDAHEKDVAELRAKVEEEEKHISEKVAVLEEEAKEAGSGRSRLTEALPASLLKRYERILKGRGIAVVPVIDGVCQGCHVAVPPQLNNTLARYDSIEQCSNCQRLLYRSELLEEMGAGADDSGDDSEASESSAAS